MAEYRLTDTDIVVRNSDGAWIPNDPVNRDRAAFETWLAAGGIPDPYVGVPAEQTVMPQDLMAQLTESDAALIRAAIEGDNRLWLLWSALQAQRDPMRVANPRFLAGWEALIAVLGEERMAEIAGNLGITVES